MVVFQHQTLGAWGWERARTKLRTTRPLTVLQLFSVFRFCFYLSSYFGGGYGATPGCAWETISGAGFYPSEQCLSQALSGPPSFFPFHFCPVWLRESLDLCKVGKMSEFSSVKKRSITFSPVFFLGGGVLTGTTAQGLLLALTGEKEWAVQCLGSNLGPCMHHILEAFPQPLHFILRNV